MNSRDFTKRKASVSEITGTDTLALSVEGEVTLHWYILIKLSFLRSLSRSRRIWRIQKILLILWVGNISHYGQAKADTNYNEQEFVMHKYF